MIVALARVSSACFLVLLGSQQQAFAVRLGGEEDAEAGLLSARRSSRRNAGPCEGRGTDEELKAWFKDHKAQLSQQAGTDEYPSGDGTHSDPSWGYLNTTCMKQRYTKSLYHIQQHANCSTVVEVGGYLTPLTQFFQGGSDDPGKAEGNKVVSYYNVDPSMAEARLEEKGNMCQVHLPMTLADFLGASELREKFKLWYSRDDTCALLMGLWDPQLKTHKDKEAIGMLTKSSMWAGIESPSDELHNFDMGTEIINLVGLHSYEDDEVNCFGTLENLRESTAIRKMRFFKVQDGNAKTPAKQPPSSDASTRKSDDSSEDSSDSTSDDSKSSKPDVVDDPPGESV